MNNNFFLKHSVRRTFFLFIIVPFVIQLVIINLIKIIEAESLYYLIFLIFAILYLPYFLWLNVVVGFLYGRKNKFFNLKLSNFKISLIINVIVVFNFIFFAAYVFSFIFLDNHPNTNILLSMVCIQFIGIPSFIYNLYFINKLIVTTEYKRKVRLNDFAGNFLVLSFPPLALWYLQSKIKKIQDKQ